MGDHIYGRTGDQLTKEGYYLVFLFYLERKEECVMENLRKVYITETYGDCAYIIITDAPSDRMKKWAQKLAEDEENGISEWLDPLEEDGYYVKTVISVDDNSGVVPTKELAEIVGYDEIIDLHEYYAAQTWKSNQEVKG